MSDRPGVRVFSRGRQMSGAGDFWTQMRNEYWSLDPDEIHERPLPEGDDKILCPGCGRYGRSLFVARCGDCGEKTYPQVILFWGCSECGATARAGRQLALHRLEQHPPPAR